ncbi:hypothetical protein SAMN03003324_00713 [Pedobacter antarcticus]|nr:hypothetical protein SAMN03003324_00713 [Pedobacter antarcticus]
MTTDNPIRTVILTAMFSMLAICSYSQNQSKSTAMKKQNGSVCSDDCTAKNKSDQMSCKLTSPELQKRKETVIASLKQQILEKKELQNGYAFKFKGTDEILDELTEFIKTERECCDFFTFAMSIGGDKKEAWLELTGANGVKEFITAELGF